MFTARYKTTLWLWSSDKCPLKKESRQPWRPNCSKQSKDWAFDSCANEGAGMTLEVPRKSWSWVSGTGCIKWGRAHSSEILPCGHHPLSFPAVPRTPLLSCSPCPFPMPWTHTPWGLKLIVPETGTWSCIQFVYWKSLRHYGCKALDLKIRKIRYTRMRWNHPKRKHRKNLYPQNKHQVSA